MLADGAYGWVILKCHDSYRVYHIQNEFDHGKKHVNGIESFWSFAKRRAAKLNEFSRKSSVSHLKERGFR
jgi:hypothetical protein